MGADFVPAPESWTVLANCNLIEPWQDDREASDMFVPNDPPRKGTPAPAVCASCPVRSHCLQKGLALGAEGWWGGEYLRPGAGLSEAERNQERAERDSKFAALYEAGHKDQAIADATGASRTAVREWRKRNQLEPAGEAAAPVPVREEDRLAALQLAAQGVSQKDIAARFGRGATTIQRWLRQARTAA